MGDGRVYLYIYVHRFPGEINHNSVSYLYQQKVWPCRRVCKYRLILLQSQVFTRMSLDFVTIHIHIEVQPTFRFVSAE